MKDKNSNLVFSEIEGKEIVDAKNRRIRLKKPSMREQYFFKRALGDDASNMACYTHMLPIMYVAMIDDNPIKAPATFGECLVNLERLGEEGVLAVSQEISKILNEEDGVGEIKKS